MKYVISPRYNISKCQIQVTFLQVGQSYPAPCIFYLKPMFPHHVCQCFPIGSIFLIVSVIWVITIADTKKKKNVINKRITFFHVNVTRPMYSPKYGNKSRTREQISMNQSNLSELKLPPESIIFFRFPLALMTSFIYDMSSIVNTMHRPPR